MTYPHPALHGFDPLVDCPMCYSRHRACPEHDPQGHAVEERQLHREHQRTRTRAGIRLAWCYASGPPFHRSSSGRLRLTPEPDLPF